MINCANNLEDGNEEIGEDKDGNSASEAGDDRAASVAMDAAVAASDDPLGLL